MCFEFNIPDGESYPVTITDQHKININTTLVDNNLSDLGVSSSEGLMKDHSFNAPVDIRPVYYFGLKMKDKNCGIRRDSE